MIKAADNYLLEDDLIQMVNGGPSFLNERRKQAWIQTSGSAIWSSWWHGTSVRYPRLTGECLQILRRV